MILSISDVGRERESTGFRFYIFSRKMREDSKCYKMIKEICMKKDKCDGDGNQVMPLDLRREKVIKIPGASRPFPCFLLSLYSERR